jgi:hypothetical protein
MSALKQWTSDQPLRRDATDSDIISRHAELESEGNGQLLSIAYVAREFAAACVQQNTEQITELKKHLAGVRAERAAPQEPTAWKEYERIAELPPVSEALENFAQDSTVDNALCLIREIRGASSLGPDQVPK